MTEPSVLLVCDGGSDTTVRLAQQLSQLHGWPLGQLERQRGQAGLHKRLDPLVEAWLRRRPAIRYHGPRPGDFALVLMLGPAGFGGLSGPLRSFIRRYAHQLRGTALLSLTRWGEAAGAADEAAQMLGLSLCLTTAFRRREIDDAAPTLAERLRELGLALSGARTLPAARRPLRWHAPSG